MESYFKVVSKLIKGALMVGLGSTIANASPEVVQTIIDSAARNGVPASVALGIASHESGFDPNATNRNTNGSTDWGVMQLNDVTVKQLGVNNPLDPVQNIEAAMSLLGGYIKKYSGDLRTALWAYASGPTAVAKGKGYSGASGFIDYATSYDPQAQGLNVGAGGSGVDVSQYNADLGLMDTSATLGPTDYVGYGGIAILMVALAGFALVKLMKP